MTNLLNETQSAISDSGKSIDDITFIGVLETGQVCTWDEFQQLADIEYDSGYGGAEILDMLVIVFSDQSHLRRGEYDGSEWWEYIPIPSIPVDQKPLKSVLNRSKWED